MVMTLEAASPYGPRVVGDPIQPPGRTRAVPAGQPGQTLNDPEQDMDSAEIEAFLTLAEELHFTRTAERLGLAQSRVSRLISSLERKVGGPLFERTSRKVALTPLGSRLRDRSAPAWAELEAAFADARRTARSAGGTLRLGWPVTASGPAVARLVDVFTSRCPDCQLVIHDVPVTDLYGPLHRGEIDVMAYWLAGYDPGLTAGPVLEYRDRVLAVGRGHRLARQESVSVEDLAYEQTHNGGQVPARLFDVLVPPVTPAGRPVQRTYPWLSFEQVPVLIATGQIVHPTMVGVQAFQRDDIVLVPIRDLPPIPFGLIWRASHENARIRALAAAACRIGPRAAPPDGGSVPAAEAAARQP